MTLGRRIRQGWLIFIKHTLNRLTRGLARRSIGPISLIRHVGRRSGKQYETPLLAQPLDEGFVIALTYGPDVDWYKNVRAAGGCTLIRHGEAYVINRIEPLATETGRAAFPLPQRMILRTIGVTHFAKLIPRSG